MMKTHSILTPLKRLRLTVLVDNVSLRRDLRGEHGFSALIETERGRLLFDVGKSSRAVLKNAAALGVELSRVDAVALSHGHYDHTGGLAAVLEEAPGARLYLHPHTAARRWGHWRGFKKSIGMSRKNIAAAEGRSPVLVSEAVALPMGVALSGSVPGPEAPGERNFTVEIAGKRLPDRFVDEMFVLADSASGVVLVTGCCHRGLINTLQHAQEVSGGRPVRTVLGGLHLGRLSKVELDAVIAALQSAGTKEVIAGHCTGKRAVDYLKRHGSFAVRTFHVGFVRDW